MNNEKSNYGEFYGNEFDVLNNRSIEANGDDLYRIERNRKQRLAMAKGMGFEMAYSDKYRYFNKQNRWKKHG